MSRKFESLERINSIRETNGNFDSCNSCKRLGTGRLHELHESKLPFVSRIEFIRSKLSNFSAHVYGVTDALPATYLPSERLYADSAGRPGIRCRPRHAAVPTVQLPSTSSSRSQAASLRIITVMSRNW